LRARQLLEGLGFFEVITYSFQPDRLGSLLSGVRCRRRCAWQPLSEEQAMMRTSLLPGLLDALRRNTLKQAQDVRLFEISKIFEPGPRKTCPGSTLAGRVDVRRPGGGGLEYHPGPVNFFDLKGMVETLLEGC